MNFMFWLENEEKNKRYDEPLTGETASEYMDRMLGPPGSRRRKIGSPDAYKQYLAIWDHQKKNVHEDEYEQDYSNLVSVNIIKTISHELVTAAQRVYDAWYQNDEGWDEMYAGGGICHDIASAIQDVLSSHNINCTTFSQSIGEVHVFAIAQFREGIYQVDIPPYVYETGGGYNWKKIKDVIFDTSDLLVSRISSDPGIFNDYLED